MLTITLNKMAKFVMFFILLFMWCDLLEQNCHCFVGNNADVFVCGAAHTTDLLCVDTEISNSQNQNQICFTRVK